jgi:polysaccharide pyruvyl transferase WcaK-like protein
VTSHQVGGQGAGLETARLSKVSFFGNFGSENSGNESTLLAVLSRLRSVAPDCEFLCICPNPEVVAARDGIEATPITTRDRGIRTLVGLSHELRQYPRAFEALKGTDLFIVPGTGLLTDAFGLSDWGPYSLFKWTLMAKLRGCKVLFVSVGAGPIDSAAGRLFAKAALSLADYRSYRDDASANYLKGIGFDTSRDRIFPDLVFGLPEMPSADGRRGRRIVGLGLMQYAGRYSAADPRRETYTTYLDSLVIFARWLLARGYDIRLLLGDESDRLVVDEFRARLGTHDPQRVIHQPAASVHETLAQIAAVDIAVVTRFHNALLALMLDKPVLAISFHHKCWSLMAEMGLGDYCHSIHHINTDRLISQFQQLERNEEDVRWATRQKVEQARRALDEQYELVFRQTGLGAFPSLRA